MTAVLDGVKRLLSRETDIGGRIEGLGSATAAARGRVDDALLDDADRVLDRARARLRLSADHTVVAIAGATGSGKSSTFNALTGLELSSVGVRRPTTSWATACVWGDGAEELLDWLGIPPRHQTTRDSTLDTRRDDAGLDGVVLLDLPDHDSTEVSHHLEVDRLVELADLLIWVLDPQKYADAAIHDRYLAPLRSQDEIMIVVLNHIDTVPEERREAMVDDVRRLLVADGLPEVPVLAVSARDGVGLDALRAEITARVATKRSARTRLETDLKTVAARVAEESGAVEAGSLSKDRVAALDEAVAEAAGIPVVVDAVERSTLLRARAATGWPLVSWASRLRRDPLAKLDLDLGSAGVELTGWRTTIPDASPVQRARLDSEVRAVADEASAGLTAPWADAVRRASTARLDELGERLDEGLSATDPSRSRIPAWVWLVRVLQWLLILAAAAGLVWTVILAISGTLAEDSTPRVAGMAVPLVMLAGGVVVGVLLALFCRTLVTSLARRRAETVDRQMRDVVTTVTGELVIAPVEAELAAQRTTAQGLEAAL